MKGKQQSRTGTMSETSDILAIPVIGDIPSRNPGLGFQLYAEAVAGAVKAEVLRNLPSGFMVRGGVENLHY
jgi:hypothetical protein